VVLLGVCIFLLVRIVQAAKARGSAVFSTQLLIYVLFACEFMCVACRVAAWRGVAWRGVAWRAAANLGLGCRRMHIIFLANNPFGFLPALEIVKPNDVRGWVIVYALYMPFYVAAIGLLVSGVRERLSAPSSMTSQVVNWASFSLSKAHLRVRVAARSTGRNSRCVFTRRFSSLRF
jgi:hypothetical protein